MVKYDNGKIYKLECLSTGKIYIGSTTQTLVRRKNVHKSQYKKYLDGLFPYMTSFIIMEEENYDIYLIEYFPCNNKEELHSREGYWQKKMTCVNKNIAGRKYKQYYQDNKEKIKSMTKKYREDNDEYYHKYWKDYYQKNKESLKENSKKYREENNNKVKEYLNEYRKKNKEKLASKASEKIECECGKFITRSNILKHKQSVFHIENKN